MLEKSVDRWIIWIWDQRETAERPYGMIGRLTDYFYLILSYPSWSSKSITKWKTFFHTIDPWCHILGVLIEWPSLFSIKFWSNTLAPTRWKHQTTDENLRRRVSHCADLKSGVSFPVGIPAATWTREKVLTEPSREQSKDHVLAVFFFFS